MSGCIQVRFVRETKWSVAFIATLGLVCVMGTAQALGQQKRKQEVSANSAGKAPAKFSVIQTVDPRLETKRKSSVPDIVAVVNGDRITQQQLAQECLRYYGKEVLESMVNKYLITTQCRKQGVSITSQEIEQEIERRAEEFGFDKNQYLALIKNERGIAPEELATDVIWPALALQKLAGPQLVVSGEELRREYEKNYGDMVQVRIISIVDSQLARRIHQKAVANPEDFSKLARTYSEDVNSASVGGLIQPIRHYMGDEKIEKAAFSLKPGEISPIIQVGNQHVFMLCEKHLARRDIPLAEVRGQLEGRIRDNKLPKVGKSVFRILQDQAEVVNVLNTPQLREKLPGVAATINGKTITLRELGEQCIARHGRGILEGLINRRLLEQALARNQRKVTKAALREEIARAAVAAGKLDKQANPDISAWLQVVTSQPGVTEKMYIRDAVWPSVALKSLVIDNVTIKKEDLKKGFEANFGPRARCRAIVLGDQRHAQRVWDAARKDPTLEAFAKLAQENSIEEGSRSQGGLVPPIQKHGGQPLLEKEAFKLKPGELSGVIQVGTRFVILYCEGYTKPVEVTFSEVKDILGEDLKEKKLRIAMARKFSQLRESAQIDNMLTGTSQAGKQTPISNASAKAARKSGARR